MQEENQNTPQSTPQPEEKKPNRDYLAPALVFIALFFSFFVLITMQKLTRKVVGGNTNFIDTKTQVVPTPEPAAVPVLTSEEQVLEDSKKPTKEVGDEIIKDIDNTTSVEAEGAYNPTELDEIAE